ncbi:hypothetical protein [Burkholderia sp. 9120]|uniref:hypothetical protein n=1 Tax=Burkholderia sp. 9120 TaxID=1500897 RepID=UPI0007C85A16|nr:hypothetical protein [Burkholderia sp. 9120]
MIAGLRARLPDITPIDAYPRIGKRIPTPSIAVELSEMEPGHDPGTGQTSLIGRFQARAIVDPLDPHADLAVRRLAARIACAVHGETWGASVTPAKLVQIGDDPFKPELDAYLVWLVEWTHEFDAGDAADPAFPLPSLPPGNGSRASTVVWGVSPDVGAAHEAAYVDPASLDLYHVGLHGENGEQGERA